VAWKAPVEKSKAMKRFAEIENWYLEGHGGIDDMEWLIQGLAEGNRTGDQLPGKRATPPWSRRGGRDIKKMSRSHQDGADGAVGSTTD
jgi:hypothetical protein